MTSTRKGPALLLLCVAFSLILACAKNATAPTPQPVSAEQQIYADLPTAQSAIEGFKEKLATFPQIKPQLNQAIASYNLAEKAFEDYERTKAADELAQIPSMITDLESKIAAVQSTFGTQT